MNDTLLWRLARRLSALCGEAIAREVRAKARACLADVFRESLSTEAGPTATAALRVAENLGPAGRGTMWRTGAATSVLEAAYANAASAGSVDMDAQSCSHPGTVVIPAAVAVAEEVDADADALIEAIVWGYEAMIRVGRLGATPLFIARGHRPTGMFGPFGAAAAAARLLGSDAAELVSALALAGNTAAGLCQWAPSGTLEGPLQNAAAASGGVRAALLASEGVCGPADLLEGRYGFLQAYCGDVAVDEDLWRDFDMCAMEQVYFKSYPTCAFTQEALEAGLTLHDELVAQSAPRAVERVDIHAYELAMTYPGCDNAGPFDAPRHCVLSTQFTVASTLAAGADWQACVRDPNTPALRALLDVTSLRVDPEAQARFPAERTATVTVRMRDGTVLERCISKPAGLPFAADGRAAPSAALATFCDRMARLDGTDSVRSALATLRPA